MGILDQVIQQTGLDTNLDNLTLKSGLSMDRVASAVKNQTAPKVTIDQTLPSVNAQTEWQSLQSQNNEETNNYLEIQRQRHERRVAENADDITNYDNLNSGNPFVNIGTNVYNMGKLAASGAVGAAQDFVGGASAMIGDLYDSNLPADVQALSTRQNNINEYRTTQNQIAQLTYDLQNKQYGALDRAEKEAKLQQLTARGQALSQQNLNPLNEQEQARLNDPAWKESIENRDTHRNFAKRMTGEGMDGKTLLGSENWGNRTGIDNVQSAVGDQTAEQQQGFEQGRKDWEAGNYLDAALNFGSAMASRGADYANAALQNPAAIAQTLGESAVYMNPYTAGLANTAMGMGGYAQGTEQYRDENMTSSIGAEDTAKIAGVSAAMAGAGMLQSKVEMGLLKGNFGRGVGEGSGSVVQSIKGKVNQASAATIAKVPKVGGALDAALRGTTATAAALTGPTSRLGFSAAAEGGTELAQTVLEQNLGLQGQINEEEAALGLGLGAATGGVMGVPGTGIDLGRKAFTAKVEAASTKQYGSKEATDEDLINPDSKHYDPSKLINRVTSSTLSNKNATPEDLQTASDKVEAAYSKSKTALAQSQQLSDDIANIDALKTEYEGKKTSYDAQYDAASKDPNRTPEQVAQIKSIFDGALASYESRIKNAEQYADKAEDIKNRLKSDTEMNTAAETAYNSFKKLLDSRKTPEENTESATTQEEASKLLGAPNFGNVQRMQALVEDQSIDESTRTQLRVVSDALIAENKAKSLGKVNQAILKGEEGNRGMSQYVSEMQTAVKSGDFNQQNILVRQLNKFTSGLEGKLTAIQEAQKVADEKGKKVRVARNKDGSWFADVDNTISYSAFKKNNGILVHPHREDGTVGADNLVAAISSNITAAKSTQLALDEIANSSRATRRASGQVSADPIQAADDFMAAMDAYNANERSTGRDTTFRDSDPNAQTVTPVQAQQAPQSLPTQTTTQTAPKAVTANPFQEQEVIDEETNAQDPQTSVAVQPTEAVASSEPTVDTTPVPQPTQVAEQAQAAQSDAVEPSEAIPVEDDIQSEQEINAKKFSTEKGWKRSELTRSVKYVRDLGDGQEEVVNTDKNTGEVLRRFKRDAEAKAIKNEIRKENRAAQTEVYSDKPNAVEVNEVFVDGQFDEDLENAYVEAIHNPEVTDVDKSTNAEGKVDSSPNGALSTFDTNGLSYKEAIAAEMEKPLTEQNLIKTGFVQRTKDAINSPLVLFKNFFSFVVDNINKYRSNDELAAAIYHSTTGKVGSNNDVRTVINLLHRLGTDLPNVQNLVKMKPEARMQYAHESYVEWLQDNGILEENVAIAVIAASMDYVASNANTGVLKARDIGKMLGVKDVDRLPWRVEKRMAYVGQYRPHFTEQLGKSVMASLQMKQLSHVDESRREKVAQALGTIALGYMLDSGLVQMQTINHAELGAMQQQVLEYTNGREDVNSNTFKNPKGQSDYVRVAVQFDEDGNVVVGKAAAKVKKQFGNSVIKDVFGMQFYDEQVSLTPIEQIPQSYNAYGNRVSKFQQGVIGKQQSTAYKLDQDMVSVLEVFNSSPSLQGELMKMLGEQNPANKLTIRKTSVESINQNIQRSLSIILDTIDTTQGKDFYLPLTLWSNMRMGISTAFNPQGNKVHRAFSSLKSEIAEIEIGNGSIFDAKGNVTSYGDFLRALGFRMDGVKIPNTNGDGIDKNDLAAYLPKMAEYIETEQVKNAAFSLEAIRSGKYKTSDVRNVSDLIQEWGGGDTGQGALTLSALNAIRAYHVAAKADAKKFNISITPESDGTNNGPAFTHILMNTASPVLRKGFGVFLKSDTAKSHSDNRREGNADMYVVLGLNKARRWEAADVRDDIRAAFDELDKNFTGRKGGKRDSIPFNYGAGYKAIVKANGREFLETIYDTLEQAVLDKDREKIQKTIGHLNTLITAFNANTSPKNRVAPLDFRNFMTLDLELDPKVENALRIVDSKVRGPVIKDALKDTLSDYIDQRNKINALSNAAFKAFKPVYMSAESAFLSDALEANPDRAKLNEGLSKSEKTEIMQSIKKYMPTLAVAMGKESFNNLTSGIPLIDTSRVWGEDAGITVQFNKELKGIHRSFKQLPANISNNVFSEPGVAGLALFIQSHDAYVTSRVMQALEVQNQHDSNSVNAHDLELMAKIQNEAFLDATTQSHLGQSFIRAVLAPMNAYADGLVSNTDKTASSLKSAFLELQEALGFDEPVLNKEVMAKVIKAAIHDMYGMDIAKMKQYMEAEVIQQYGTEKGEYVITDGKRIELENRLKALEHAMKKDLDKVDGLVKGLQKFFDQPKTSLTTMPAATFSDVESNEVAEVLQETKQEQARTKFESGLLDNRDKLKDPKALIQYTLNNLKAYLDANKGDRNKVEGRLFSSHYAQLIKMSEGSLGNLKVNIVTDQDDTSHIASYADARAKNLHAWFINQDGQNEINIRVGTGERINPKVIAHELIHAATHNAIHQVGQIKETGKGAAKYKTAIDSLDRLNALYEHVKKQVNQGDNNLADYALGSLDEFIATGLTYPEFMRQLDNMAAPADLKYKRPAVNSVFKDLIENILKVFYAWVNPNRTLDPKTVSAYEALVLDTANFVQRTQSMPAIRSYPRVGDLLGAPKVQAHEEVKDMKASELFKNLPESGDASFDAHLSELMDSVADRVFDKSLKSYDGTEYSPEQIWNHALQNEEKPYISEAFENGYTMSAREQYAVELFEVAMQGTMKDKSLTIAFKDLGDAYETAKKVLKVEDFHNGDWATADADEQERAQSKYNYLFDTENKDYLARFISMGMANKEVNKLLSMKLSRKSLQDENNNPWFDRAAMYLDRAVDKLISYNIANTGKDSVSDHLSLIAKRFIDIDHKNRNKVMEKIEQALEEVDNTTNRIVSKAANKLSEGISKIETDITPINIARNISIQTLSGKPLALFDVILDLRAETLPNSTLDTVGELIKEAGNTSDNARTVESLMRETKMHENKAQTLRTEIKHDVLSLFVNNGKDMTKEVRQSVTNALLRTDLQALASKYSMAKISRYILNDSARKAEIKYLERGLSDVHISRARDLARFMVTGKGNEFLAPNALAIAMNVGTNYVDMNPSDQLVEQIEHLTSLLALDYTNKNDRKNLADVVTIESKNGGVENLLKYHKSLVADSKRVLFGNTPLNMTKGFMPDVTNPYRGIEIATTQADVDRLRASMYTEVKTLGTSQADPTGFNPVMFYTEDAGSQQYVSGAMALYNHGSKGRKIEMDPREMADAVNFARNKAMNFGPNYDPFKAKDGMIPTYDGQGNISGMRYMMSSSTKDEYLERNNDFSDLIGVFMATGYNKVANINQNQKVVDTLKDIYDNSRSIDRNKFVYVSYEATDPVAYAAWDRLSKDTKEYVKEVWGEYGMWVSNETFLTVFGHPKMSLLTQAFDTDQAFRGVMGELYVTMMKGLFGENSRIYAAKTERMWQEMVALTKNFVVIRNVSTLMMNVAANTFLLMAHGVPVEDIIKNTKDSILGGMQYRKTQALLTKLEARLRAGIGDTAATRQEINKLKHRLEQNPMHSFIDAGMFAGIVEDIDPEMNMYSYQSSMQKKFEGQYEKVPYFARRALEYAFVTPSTPMYQFLHSATQYSDFSAKYVMYKYYTEKAKTKLSHEEALQEASDNFINYDVPTSPVMQYANDMGLLMFTKYNIRIQRALFKLVTKRPASALSQFVLMNQFSSLPPGIDPIVFNQVGNPFRTGAFGFFGVLDEPFPLKILF